MRYCAVVLFIFAGIATATTLLPTDTLEITFSTFSPTCHSGPCDALQVFPTGHGSFGVNGGTFQLFNGATLLGTLDDTPFCCVAVFHSSTSLSTQGMLVDFTAINNGSVNGIIDLRISSGSLTWVGNPMFVVLLANATGPGTYAGGTGLTVTSIHVIPGQAVPEPNSLCTVLLGTGLLFWGMRKANRSKGRSHARSRSVPMPA